MAIGVSDINVASHVHGEAFRMDDECAGRRSAIAGLVCTIAGFVVMFFTQNQGYGGLFAS